MALMNHEKQSQLHQSILYHCLGVGLSFVLYQLYLLLASKNEAYPKENNGKVCLPMIDPLYSSAVHFLALGHLGCFPLRGAGLETLVIPSLGAELVQSLLLFAAGSRALLATTYAGLGCLDQGGIVAVQRVSFQIIVVRLVGKDKGAELGVHPAGSCIIE